MVTQEMLARLRAERERPHASLEHRIGGTTQVQVDRQVMREREQRIAHGEQSLQDALHSLRQEQAFATRQGLAQAQFNHQAQEKL